MWAWSRGVILAGLLACGVTSTAEGPQAALRHHAAPAAAVTPPEAEADGLGWAGVYQATSEEGAAYVMTLEPSPVVGLEGVLEVEGADGRSYVLRVQGIPLPGSGDLQVMSLGRIRGEPPWQGSGPDAELPLFVLGVREDGLLVTELGVLPGAQGAAFWRR